MSLSLLLPSTAAAPTQVVQGDEKQFHLDNCQKTYTQLHVRRAVRSVWLDTSRITGRERRKVRYMIRCAKRPQSRPAMHRTVRKFKRWRGSYTGYWRLSSARLSASVHATLARLRHCESTGNYRVVNASGHAGAYQFSASTWQRAQGWVGVPSRYRRWSVLAASKDHQDAVTGRFYFAHRGEWVCSA